MPTEIKDLYALLVETVTDYAIFVLDAEGRVRTWNPGARRLKGYEAHEIIGEHFSRFYPQEARDRKWPEQELSIASAQGRFEDEGWRIRKDGSRFWANVVITALRDSAGELIGFSKVTRDLTERRQREEALLQSEARLRLLIEGVQDYAIFMLDPHGRVASWNTGAQRIKGYTAEEIIGHHFSVFYPPEALERRWPEHELSVAKAEGRFEDEGWRVRKDGSQFWANVVITALREPGGALLGFAKITRDLTQRRQVEELRTSERRMQEFLAMLGHELRNPLAPISASLQVLLKSQSADTEEELAKRVMQRQLGQLTRVVEDLLDVSRVTQASIQLRRRVMDLVAAVRSAAEAARPWIDSHGHQLTVKLPDHPVQIEADEQRLNQVLLNLLNNAAKYTPVGSPGTELEFAL